MAKIVWTIPALLDVEEIAEYIAIENQDAAAELVARLFTRSEQLVKHPESGAFPMELMGGNIRQLVVSPCRIFYTYDGESVFIMHVLRFERIVRMSRFEKEK